MSWFNRADPRNYCACGHNEQRHTLKLGDLLMCFDCQCAEFSLTARDVSAVIAHDPEQLAQDAEQFGGRMVVDRYNRDHVCDFYEGEQCPHWDHSLIHDWGPADGEDTGDLVDLWFRERRRYA